MPVLRMIVENYQLKLNIKFFLLLFYSFEDLCFTLFSTKASASISGKWNMLVGFIVSHEESEISIILYS